MIEFCKEVVEAIKPLIQHEGEYTVNIIDEPYYDENDKYIKKNGSHVHVKRVDKNTEKYVIDVNLNVYEEKPEVLKFVINRGFDIYLQNLGVEMTRHSLFVLTCIHEFGHVNMMLECASHGSLPNYLHIARSSQYAVRTLFPESYRKERFVEHRDSLRYRYSFDETYADSFALIHFMNVWNQVKHLV